MEIRNAVDPAHAKIMDTEELRERFLIENLFEKDRLNLTYSYYDRLIVGGVCPSKDVKLEADKKIIGADFFLERREMGIINIGSPGCVKVDGQVYELNKRDGLYIGMGAKEVIFSSKSSSDPSKFYLTCAPAHMTYPTTQLSINDAEPVKLGDDEASNKRVIYKYIHPDGIRSCQLVMGMTLLEPKNVWNTMPTHTHPRRMEAYFYFDISDDVLIFHMMGEPEETRHIIMKNEQAVLSPSWSIHSGVGTRNYSFIWGMAGENQTFTDMDNVPMSSMK